MRVHTTTDTLMWIPGHVVAYYGMDVDGGGGRIRDRERLQKTIAIFGDYCPWALISLLQEMLSICNGLSVRDKGDRVQISELGF
jgi:hypothetical protein